MLDLVSILSKNKAGYDDDLRIVRNWAEYDKDREKMTYLMFELEMEESPGQVVHFYKAIKLVRIKRLPKSAKQSEAFMSMHAQLLSAVWKRNIKLTTIIANVLTPVVLGLLFCYGVQGVASTAEDAKEIADKDFIALVAELQGTYRVLKVSLLDYQELEWLREKMFTMKNLTVVRGIPKPKEGGVDVGNKGIGSKNINPESQDTTEEFVAGMSEYEYVIQILSSPVRAENLERWLEQTAKEMTRWNKQLQGTSTVNFSLSIPMMYMANLGASEGWSHSYTDANSVSTTQSDTFSTSFSNNIGESMNQSVGQTLGRSLGQSYTESYGQSHGVNVGQNMGSNVGTSLSDSWGNSIGHSDGQNIGFSENQNHGASVNQSESDGTSHTTSTGQSVTDSTSETHSISNGTSGSVSDSTGNSHSTGTSHSTSDGTNTGDNWGGNKSTGESSGTNGSMNFGSSDSKSHGTNSSSNWSVNAGIGAKVGPINISGGGSGGHSWGESDSTTSGTSFGWSNGRTDGTNSSNGTSWGGSSGTSHSTSNGTSESWGTSNSHTESNGWSQGISDSLGKTHSVGNTTGTSDGTTHTNSTGSGESWSNGTGKSWGNSISDTQSANVSNSAGKSQGQSWGNSSGENWGTNQSQSYGQTQTDSYSQSLTQGTGKSWGQSQGTTQGQSWGSSQGRSLGQAIGSSGTMTSGSASTMGIGPSMGFARSYQWLDQEVQNILTLLDFQNMRLMKALRGNGAFFTDLYIATQDEDGLAAASILANSAWHNEEAMICPLQTLDLSPEEQAHLLYHFSAFSADNTKENVSGRMESYRYSTILLPDEFTAYTHLPRISEGGIYADVGDIPKFAVPSMLKGDIYLGKVLSAERWTMQSENETKFEYRLSEKELMHGIFTGESRSGKTVAATRFISELTKVIRSKTGKRLRIVALDPKQDWRILAKFVEPDRFHFYSLGNPEFLPINLNICKVPHNVIPQVWIDGIIEIYCRAYGLMERGKSILAETFYELYEEAGVLEDSPNWRDFAPERSAKVTLPKLYERMNKHKVDLDDPTKSGKGRAGNEARDAYTRVLDRMQVFGRKFSIETRMFGQDDGIGIDELIGKDDVIVLESYGLESTFKNFIFGCITSGFFKYAQGHEGGFLADDQYETVLVIEEANEVLTGSDTAGQGGGGMPSFGGQSEFEKILDQAAGLGLFIISITQKIASMPSSVIANSGLLFAGKISREDDTKIVIRKIGREERLDDRDILKWFPRSPIGWFVCRSSRNFDFIETEPVLVHIDPLNVEVPDNKALESILSKKRAMELLNA